MAVVLKTGLRFASAFSFFLFSSFVSFAQVVDYSVTSVPEETGLYLSSITTDNDYVFMPRVVRTRSGINWATNRVLDISYDGSKIAFLSTRNKTTNIFTKDLGKTGPSVQRTTRNSVQDFSYSPDGSLITFSEITGAQSCINQTDSEKGFICRRLTGGAKDYGPVYNDGQDVLFFTRQEGNSFSIWSYELSTNLLSSYTSGYGVVPIPESTCFFCTRKNDNGLSEIWKIDYVSGIEECIVSGVGQSFANPVISPDRTLLLFVGSSRLYNEAFEYWNTDIYVCNIDGTNLQRLTYHAADDLCPVWSKDGRYIYFISQRGSASATPNIWKMNYMK